MQTECRISSLLEYYAEPQLILCKDNPITYKHKIKGSETYLFSLNPTKILYARTTTESLQVQTTDLGLNYIHVIFPTAWGKKPHIRGFYSHAVGEILTYVIRYGVSIIF